MTPFLRRLNELAAEAVRGVLPAEAPDHEVRAATVQVLEHLAEVLFDVAAERIEKKQMKAMAKKLLGTDR